MLLFLLLRCAPQRSVAAMCVAVSVRACVCASKPAKLPEKRWASSDFPKSGRLANSLAYLHGAGARLTWSRCSATCCSWWPRRTCRASSYARAHSSPRSRCTRGSTWPPPAASASAAASGSGCCGLRAGERRTSCTLCTPCSATGLKRKNFVFRIQAVRFKIVGGSLVGSFRRPMQ